MNTWLTAKTFGMPRWLFLLLLIGGVVVGLYLRSRRKARENMAPEDLPLEDSAEGLYESGDPGLAGVGVVSPPGGVYPVTTPVLPEGLTDLVGGLGDTITNLGNVVGTMPSAIQPQPVQAPVTPVTGGGPPDRPASHSPSAPGCISEGEYSRRLGEIRDRHGSGSAEVNRFRSRWTKVGSKRCPA